MEAETWQLGWKHLQEGFQCQAECLNWILSAVWNRREI